MFFTSLNSENDSIRFEVSMVFILIIEMAIEQQRYEFVKRV